jgi:hypothetical protein
VSGAAFFDTVRINVGDAAKVVKAAAAQGVNLRQLDAACITVAIDETTTLADVDQLLAILNGGKAAGFTAESLAPGVSAGVGAFARTSPFLQHPVFNAYHTGERVSVLGSSSRQLPGVLPAFPSQVPSLLRSTRFTVAPPCLYMPAPRLPPRPASPLLALPLALPACRARAAALPEAPGEQGPVPVPLHDPPGLLYHEAQRDLGCAARGGAHPAGRPGGQPAGEPASPAALDVQLWS